MVTDDMLEVMQASRIASEAGVAAAIVTAGDEYKRVTQVAATGRTLVVPVNFPDAPDVSDEANALEVRTEELRHWQAAPGNAAALAKAGRHVRAHRQRLKDVKMFRANVGKAIARGLPEATALAAVTTVPAKLLGLTGKLGVIAPGAIANLTVTRGSLFAEGSKVREVWVDGVRLEAAKDETQPKGDWIMNAGAGSAPSRTLKVATEAETTVSMVTGSDTTRGRTVRLTGTRLQFALGDDEWDLTARNDALTGTVFTGSKEAGRERAPEARRQEARQEGARARPGAGRDGQQRALAHGAAGAAGRGADQERDHLDVGPAWACWRTPTCSCAAARSRRWART
jgi:hypothetical protein